ncbi:MAG: CAP domain-containing protein [Caldisericia bacterium]
MRKALSLILVATMFFTFFVALPDFTYAASKSDSTRLFNMINDYRVQKGLSKIQWHESAYVVAYNHTVNMHNTQQLSHDLDGKGPDDRLRDAGIDYSCYVENVAFNHGHTDPVQSAFNQWKKSAGHNENMLSDCPVYGCVAVVSSDSAGWYFTFLGLTTTTSPGGSDGGGGSDTVGDTIRYSMKHSDPSPTYTMTWTNTGDTNLTIKWKVEYDEFGSGWLIVTPTSAFLKPGESAEFEFSFTAGNLITGLHEADLTFYHEVEVRLRRLNADNS